MLAERERVRRATLEDAPALNRLFAEVFGHVRDLEIWRWKFAQHPVGAWSWVCEADGQIVAHCGAIAVRFEDHGRRIVAVQLVDFMSSPRYAGGIGAGGVFAKITTALFRDLLASGEVRLLYGFPGERHRLVGERLLGYRSAGPVGELRLKSSGSFASVRPLETSDLDRFSSLPSPMHALRDREYVRWRYLDHPTASYEIVETKRRWFRRPAMSAIVRREPGVVRLMEAGGSFAPQHLRELIEQLRGLGEDVIGWCSPHHRLTAALLNAGFTLAMRDHSLAAAWFLDRPEPSERRYFENEPPPGSELYISLGDYDVY